jgi:hypothetical protein
MGKFQPVSLRVRPAGLLGDVTDRIESEFSWLRSLNDPKGVYARMPVELVIH